MASNSLERQQLGNRVFYPKEASNLTLERQLNTESRLKTLNHLPTKFKMEMTNNHNLERVVSGIEMKWHQHTVTIHWSIASNTKLAIYIASLHLTKSNDETLEAHLPKDSHPMQYAKV